MKVRVLFASFVAVFFLALVGCDKDEHAQYNPYASGNYNPNGQGNNGNNGGYVPYNPQNPQGVQPPAPAQGGGMVPAAPYQYPSN